MKDVNDERLQELISQNLGVLKQMINYNVRNKIRLFRISSDLIPFGSSEVNRIKWWELFREQFKEIGEIAKKNHIRLSMKFFCQSELTPENPQNYSSGFCRNHWAIPDLSHLHVF